MQSTSNSRYIHFTRGGGGEVGKKKGKSLNFKLTVARTVAS